MANFIVTNTNDSGAGSLRQAIIDANASAGITDSITFASGLSGQTIILTSGQLDITDSLSIDGDLDNNGTADLTLSGNNASRIFEVNTGTSTVLDGLTITRGNATNSDFKDGGGIVNEGTLTINNSTFSGNSARYGGGIANYSGTLTINNTTFSGNSAIAGGGAIDNTSSSIGSASLTINNSTFSGNSAGTVGGGAIFNDSLNDEDTAILTINSSTFSGNSTAGEGGGIYNLLGRFTINNSIVAGNSAAEEGREIYNFILSTSSGRGSSNLFGYGGDNGYFDEFDFSSIGYITPTVGLNQILETTLANNGGPTQTLALVAGSPAINAGNTTLTTDQRGITRPQGGADDIGAFELVPPPNIPPIARSDSFTTNEDTLLVGNVITNTNPNGADSDPDNNPLTIATVNGSAANVGTAIFLTNGSLTLNANGSFTYTPNTNANGSDSFTYTLSDGTNASNTATVSLTITGVNDNPTDLTLSNSTVAENSALGTVIGSFSTTDPDDASGFTYSLVDGANFPDNAAFTIDGNQLKVNAAFDFESDSSYSIKVRTTDEDGGSYEETFTIGITDVDENTAPTDLALSNTAINENVAAGTTVGTFSTTDAEGGSFIYEFVAGAGDTDNDAFTIDGDQLQINSSPDFETQDSYTIRVQTTDSDGLSYEESLTIEVNDLNEAPTANPDSLNTNQNSPLSISPSTLLANDTDPDDDTLSITGVSASAGGTVSLNSGTILFTPNSDFTGAASFSYTLSDGALTSIGNVTVNVAAVAGVNRNGGNGNDTLTGGLGRDTLNGGNGNDLINGGAGGDTLNGDNGNDTLNGEAGDDRLSGDNGNDILTGGLGRDTLLGGNGNDLLIGSADADVLTGDNGSDTFRFALSDSLLANFDRITDLQIGTDIIDGPNAVSAANVAELGAVSGLTQAGIGAVLTNGSFGANRAATFSLGSRTFVALNDGTAGFQAASDGVIEITGFSGSLASLAIA